MIVRPVFGSKATLKLIQDYLVFRFPLLFNHSISLLAPYLYSTRPSFLPAVALLSFLDFHLFFFIRILETNRIPCAYLLLSKVWEVVVIPEVLRNRNFLGSIIMSRNGFLCRSRLRIKASRNLFKRIFLLCVITALAASLPGQLFSAEQESFKVQMVESNFFTSFKSNLSELFGPDENNEIPPARKVTWDDLYDLDLETHRPSVKLQSRLSSEVSIKGFIIPMEYDEQRRVTELLLVPYIPSCMHVPPPPSNQMVHVKLNEGAKVEDIFFPIEAVGHLKIAKGEFYEGYMASSYEMEVRSMEVLKDSSMDPFRDFFGSAIN